MQIAYICGPTGSGKSTLGRLVASWTGVRCISLDLVLRETLLRASGLLRGANFDAQPNQQNKENWDVLFRDPNLAAAFDSAFRATLHLSVAETFPKRMIIEGSQLVWPYWRDPLRPIFKQVFRRDCEWGLFLVARTPHQLIAQIRERKRPHEQHMDLAWAEEKLYDYTNMFELLKKVWGHSIAQHQEPALLADQITAFLGPERASAAC
jgi:hypothetical protein